MADIRVHNGSYRKLTRDERYQALKQTGRRFKYITTKPYHFHKGNTKITVPTGFLTDGATGVPDWGNSWVFHDYLYGTHSYSSGEVICRRDADRVMSCVLKKEGRLFYRAAFRVISRLNPFGLFSRAWRQSGTTGAIIASFPQV